MSERTTPALTKLDALLASLDRLPATSERDSLIEDTSALRRAVAAFHMEAIRFRMYSVDRLLKDAAGADESRRIFDEVRQALEEAGFHTRSHSAP